MASNNSNQNQPESGYRRSDRQHFKPRRRHRGLLWSLLIVVLILVTGGVAYGYHVYNDAKTRSTRLTNKVKSISYETSPR